MSETIDAESEPSKAWYQSCWDELGGHSQAVPQPHWLEGDWPDWVANAGREIAKTFFPVAQLKSDGEMSPRILGGILGHQIAAVNALCETLQDPEPAAKGIAHALQPKGGFPDTFAESFAGYFEHMAEVMKRACAGAIEADYAECAEFFSAFADGMKQTPNELERTNTRIILTLLIGWRTFVQFPSIRAVHEAFCKGMGVRLVGNLKRFEKMCQRIGFKVRGKGRPKTVAKVQKFRRRKG